jgi:hypothetical protein
MRFCGRTHNRCTLDGAGILSTPCKSCRNPRRTERPAESASEAISPPTAAFSDDFVGDITIHAPRNEEIASIAARFWTK